MGCADRRRSKGAFLSGMKAGGGRPPQQEVGKNKVTFDGFITLVSIGVFLPSNKRPDGRPQAVRVMSQTPMQMVTIPAHRTMSTGSPKMIFPASAATIYPTLSMG